MLGQPMSMLIPQVVGFKLHGELPEGATATDLVLTVTEMLREQGRRRQVRRVLRPGRRQPAAGRPRDDRQHEPGVRLDLRDLPDRRARRCATCAFTGRPKELVELVEAYAKEQGLWHDERPEEPTYSDTLELDLGDVVPSLAGPKRPQDRVALTERQGRLPRGARRPAVRRRRRGAPAATTRRSPSPSRPPTRRRSEPATATASAAPSPSRRAPRARGRSPSASDAARRRDARTAQTFELDHGHVVIAAITSARTRRTRRSCSAPACWPARPWRAGWSASRGSRRRWRPGSKVVTEYLDRAGLTEPLEALGFHLVGYGCTTCIGNSGPLPEEISARGRRARPRGRLGALRQPQLRGPHQPRREDELPRLAAAGRRLRARRHDGHRPVNDPLGRTPTARTSTCATSGRPPRRSRGRSRRRCSATCSASATARSSRATSAGTALEVPDGRPLRVGRRLDLRAPAAVLRGHGRRARRR